MEDQGKIEALEQEISDMKKGFAAMIEMKDKQLAELRRALKEYDKICDALKANILAKDNELARLR